MADSEKQFRQADPPDRGQRPRRFGRPFGCALVIAGIVCLGAGFWVELQIYWHIPRNPTLNIISGLASLALIVVGIVWINIRK